MTLPPKKPRLGTTARVVAMCISTTAALFTITTLARAWSLFGGPAPSYLTIGSLTARWVGVTPVVDTLTSVGDSLQIAATVTGRNGSTLIGPTVGWSSDDPRVATVGADGKVVARAQGTTTIVATVGSLAARSRITVRQRVANVHLAEDSALTLAEGERYRAIARAVDARGHAIPRRAARWMSGDTNIVAVDSTGELHGRQPGHTTLTVSVDGVEGQTSVATVPIASVIALAMGQDQHAPAGSALPQPIVVRVLDRREQPISNVAIRFRAGGESGHAEPGVVYTDGLGRAETVWTLGEYPGPQNLLVLADRLDSGVVVNAEAEPVVANTRVEPVREPQRARVGAMLADPVVVRVTDTLGRPLRGVPVTWTAPDGGRIAAVEARTDSSGEVRAEWTLGTKSGAQRARVVVGSGRAVPPAIVTAYATPAPPSSVQLVRGSGQRARVAASLGQPVLVRVRDTHGNPVPDTRLTIVPAAGSVTDSIVATDSAGNASISWTLGRAAGAQRLVVRAQGVEKPLEVTATARPAEAANVEIVAIPQRGTAGRALRDAVLVRVTDAYGNPVGNAPVSFAATEGAVSPVRAMTDARGEARTRWTLGRKAGEQSVSAAVRGTEVRATAALRATAPAPAASTPATKRPAAPRG